MTAKKFCISGHVIEDCNYKSRGRRCYECHKIKQREYSRAKGKRWQRDQNLKRYGITADHWDKVFEEQNRRCALCDTAETPRWMTDHDHTTGRFRGILCNSCNTGLGYIEKMLHLNVEDYLFRGQL